MASNPVGALRSLDVADRAERRLAAIENASPQKRLRILHHATEMFLDRGFPRANLDEIAIAASVGKAAIYQLFGDKTELFARCMLQSASAHSELLRNVLRVDLPVEQVLVTFAERHIIRMFRPVCGSRPFYEFVRVLLSASISHPGLSQRVLAMFREQEGAPLTEYFAEMMRRGAIIQNDPAYLTNHFLQATFFTTHLILAPDHAAEYRDVRKRAERTVHLFLYGCSPLGARSGVASVPTP